MLKKQFFYFCFLIGMIFLQNSTLQPKNLGKPYFEKAYSIEKEDPDKAIELYNKALKEGLDADLRKTALWRLYFIYKDKKKYILAWSILKQIPNKSSVENKFYEDVQYYTKLSKEDFLNLYKAIQENDLSTLKIMYRNASPFVKKEILDFYLEKNQNQIIEDLAFVDTNSNIDSKLFLANYLIENNRYEQAEKILFELSTNDSHQLSYAYKENILYLIGKIKREKNILDSIPYFLLSANYSTTSRDYEKELTLALYSLYRAGYEEIVYELSEYIYYLPNDPMQKLFVLLIKTEKNPTKNNLFELKKLIVNLNKNSFLVQRAQKVLIENGYYD